MLDRDLPPQLKAFAEREFLGERLLWAERPDQRILFLLSFGIWLFAIPWTAFALFWISIPGAALYEAYAGVNIGAPKGAPTLVMWAFALFGLPFIAVGFGMLLSPFARLRKSRRTLYVVTNKRIAVLEGKSAVTVTSIMPGEISGLSRKEGPDGRGTLVLSLGYEKDSEGGRVPKTAELGVVADVRKVEGIVRQVSGRAA